MKFIKQNIHAVLALIAFIAVTTACTEIVGEENVRGQEQRFFDLYVAAKYPDVSPLSNGLYFIEHEAGTGVSPDADDWLLVNHVGYKIPGDIVFESYIENVVDDHRLDPNATALYGPFKMKNGERNDGLTQGLGKMKEGGKATMFFTSDLGYGEEGTGTVPPYTSLKYEVELLEVIKDIEAYEQAKITAYVDTIPDADTIHNPETDAVMYVIKTVLSKDVDVVKDSIVSVAYTGYLTDGRVFDQRTAEDPFEVTVGKEQVIKGWDLGLLRLKVGEKATFVIPYPLAYGEEGDRHKTTGLQTIPPYETLLFDIHVLSMKEDPKDDSSD